MNIVCLLIVVINLNIYKDAVILLANMEIFNWYKSRKEAKRLEKEETARERVEKEVKLAKEKELDKKYSDALDNVVIFVGNVAEYEKFKGYEPGTVIACDTGSTRQDILIRMYDKGRVVNSRDNRLRNRLIDDGLEALVHAKLVSYNAEAFLGDSYFAMHGLPVKKAE